MKDFEEFTLDNGLKVVYQQDNSKIFNTILRVNQGPIHEKHGEEGLSHFLEHCVISAGSNEFEMDDFFEMERNLGYSNASTSPIDTRYEVYSLKDDFEMAMNYLAGCVFNPRFEEGRVEGERDRVLEEIKDEKILHYQIGKEMGEFFFRGHPKGIEILGDENIVSEKSIDFLKDFHSRRYNPSNSELMIVGSIPSNAKETIGKYFGKYDSGPRLSKEIPELSVLEKEKAFHVKDPRLLNEASPLESPATIQIQFVAPKEGDEDFYATSILEKYLGGTTVSQLYQVLGLEMGLAYATQAIYDPAFGAGGFSIQAQIPATSIEEAKNAMFEELEMVREVEIKDRKLESVKKHIKFRKLLELTTYSGKLEEIERYLDNMPLCDEFLEKVKNTSDSKILEVAKKYFPASEKSNNYVMGICDPLKEE